MSEVFAEAPERKGPRTATRIREAALELFSRLGFERTTMADIAAEAGVSQPALHYHFTDKADLWRAAMLHLSAAIEEESRPYQLPADTPPEVQLRAAMERFLDISWKHPALGRIVAIEGMAGGERLEWLDRHLIGPRNRGLVALAQAAIDSGALKPFPAPLLLITLQTAGVGVVNLAPMMRLSFGYDPSTPQARDDHARLVVDALLGGLLTPPAPDHDDKTGGTP